ncbi:hypothetical protein CHISP_3759 [Chitinispirillum alkaliphilum]|nr:hypothetical protein CHISP_3759 [Chitinispirillum alkaliphilum]
MHLIFVLTMVFASVVVAQGDIIDCSNYEELILKRFSLEPFDGGSGDFRSGKQLYHGTQEKELYLSDFFDVASVTSAEYIECDEKVTTRIGCWTDTFTVQIYSNGVVIESGQTFDWYLISGEDVILNSELEIGDSKERVLEVLGKPRWKFENMWYYDRKTEREPFPGERLAEVQIQEEIAIILSFIDDRLALIDCPIVKAFCVE